MIKQILFFRDRIKRMKEEDELEKQAVQKRLQKDIITKTFPRTREDFDQLYAMVDICHSNHTINNNNSYRIKQ